MSLKDFKLSAVDASQGLSLGECAISEKISAKVHGTCGGGFNCAGGGGQCGGGFNCPGGGGQCGGGFNCSGN